LVKVLPARGGEPGDEAEDVLQPGPVIAPVVENREDESMETPIDQIDVDQRTGGVAEPAAEPPEVVQFGELDAEVAGEELGGVLE